MFSVTKALEQIKLRNVLRHTVLKADSDKVIRTVTYANQFFL